MFGGGGGLVLQLQHLVHRYRLERPPMQGLSDSEYQGHGACGGLGDSQAWHCQIVGLLISRGDSRGWW